MVLRRKALTVIAVGALMPALLILGGRPTGVMAAGPCVNPGGTGGCSATIQAAVDAAASGDTIAVAAGTYTEHVTINKAVSLQGAGAGTTIIDASSPIPAVGIVVSGVTTAMSISGFTVQNAPNEGILVQNSSNITVQNNILQFNDKGLQVTKDGATCAGATPGDQEDCGETVHFQAVSNSTIANNVIQNNVAGILLTDETGPTHDNKILNNTVVNNPGECGITLASHATGQAGVNPGGIYNNTVMGNLSANNGASGIGLFASAPGTATYNNLVQGNTIYGNGHAGVTLHAHAPNQKVSGNKIINNTIGQNNSRGDEDAGDMATTGILIMSAVVPVTGTVVTGNAISNNQFGIWMANVVHPVLSGNTFTNIKVPSYQAASIGPALNTVVAMPVLVSTSASGVSGSFTVTFTSKTAGNGQVLFGSGPGCVGLVQTADQDAGAGSTLHTVLVSGNMLPGTVGNIGIQPGATYSYEVVNVTSTGTEIDNNGGNCYTVTIPSF